MEVNLLVFLSFLCEMPNSVPIFLIYFYFNFIDIIIIGKFRMSTSQIETKNKIIAVILLRRDRNCCPN